MALPAEEQASKEQLKAFLKAHMSHGESSAHTPATSPAMLAVGLKWQLPGYETSRTQAPAGRHDAKKAHLIWTSLINRAATQWCTRLLFHGGRLLLWCPLRWLTLSNSYLLLICWQLRFQPSLAILSRH
jgi:hypothetical protein